jgi:hypothetical protein
MRPAKTPSRGLVSSFHREHKKEEEEGQWPVPKARSPRRWWCWREW